MTTSSRPIPRDALAAAEDQALDLLYQRLDEVTADRRTAASAIAALQGIDSYLAWAEDRMTAQSLLLDACGDLLAALDTRATATQREGIAALRAQIARERIALYGASATLQETRDVQ